jgi:uncharacterized protein (DUF885 family)
MRGVLSILVVLSVCSVVSCGPPSGPADLPLPPEPPAPPAEPEAAGWAAYRDGVLARWLKETPRWGRDVGLHDEHDSKVADYRKTAITQRIAWLREVEKKLSVFESDRSLGADDRLDVSILKNKVTLELFNLHDRAMHEQNPAFYQELFDVSSYLDFEYAPISERALRLVKHEEAALAQVGNVLGNLRPTLSRPVVETSIKIYTGYVEYLRGDVVRLVGAAAGPALQQRFKAANDELAAHAERIAKTLEKEFLPRADDKSHVLGRDVYLRFVAAQEGRNIDLGELHRMADADLARNKSDYEKLAKTAKFTRPKATELLAAATKLMDDSQRFIVEKKLVTIPSDERATLRETPPYMRWNAAFLNMPGPFDTAKQAFYYITLPDPTWPKKEQEEYLFPWGTLLATTVHEVWPGHFLHGLWVRRAPTRIQKMVDAYSFTEGWAHYTEQLMVEQGFGAQDPQNKLGQLSDALLRNCRFVASIGIHAEGMSLDRAAELFEKDCFQDKATARQQAVRGTFDPGYFAYTLGKLQILELRTSLQHALGDKFDLRRFHDALLSHGAPPVALIAERVKRDLGAIK